MFNIRFNIKHSEFSPRSLVLSSLWFLQQTAIIYAGIIHHLVFLIEAQDVLYDVRTDYVTSAFSEAVS
jgi:hypothetical protein